MFSLLDTLEFDTSYASYCKAGLLSSNVAVVVYRNTMSSATVATISWDENFDLIKVDTLELGTFSGYTSVCILSPTSFAVAYTKTTTGGSVAYCTCDANGDNIILEDTLVHAPGVTANFNSACTVTSTSFMIACHMGGGYIKTFSINRGAGTIVEEDSLNWNGAGQAYHNSLMHLTGSYYVLAYSGPGSDGYVMTISIEAGIDNISTIDGLEFDTNSATSTSLAVIDSTHFAIAYQGISTDGYIKTFSVDSGGDNITEIDELEHDITSGAENSLTKVDATHLTLAYYGSSSWNGRLKVFTLDGSYNLAQSTDFVFEDSTITSTTFIQIDATHYFLAYKGPDNDGFAKAFLLEGVIPLSIDLVAPGMHHRRDSFGIITPGKFRLVISNYSIQAWGKARMLEGLEIEAVGLHDAGISTFVIQAPGVIKQWNRFILWTPGLARIESSFIISAIGSSHVLGNLEIGAVGMARFATGLVIEAPGMYNYQLPFYQKAYRQGYRVADDSLEQYELYVGEDEMPDFTDPPAASGASLPVSWDIPVPDPGETVVLYVVPRYRNRYDLLSHNQHPTLIEVDEDLLEDYGPLSAPELVKIMDGNSGEIMIHARYPSGVDRHEADHWELYAEVGTDPDPDADTPVLTAGFGAPGADYTWVGTATGLTPGETYRVLVVVRRLIDGVWAAADQVEFMLAEAFDLDPDEGSMFAGQEYEIGD